MKLPVTPVIETHYKTKSQSPSLLARLSPSVGFYSKMARIVFRSSREAKRGEYKDVHWAASSREIMEALESTGVQIEIENIEMLKKLNTPCVFVANHMSTLETFILPAIIQPLRNVVFVVKRELTEYPVFRYVNNSRNPIIVDRKNPKDDLKAILDGGAERLKNGISVIVFPQTTRTTDIDPKTFNSIGVKLAARAGVPIVPIALRSDAWGMGKLIKDFGKINPAKPVKFCFGEPIPVIGTGKEAHEKVIEFISGKLNEWFHR
ncbi:MAG: 1-acyl-sn-glycerol-3-phosphate acyltransferase [Chlorobiales bacterium]|nr:1-acyl-sn-glycerol-3-phosphate acyltransferase [Chlorobiales bacterium]